MSRQVGHRRLVEPSPCVDVDRVRDIVGSLAGLIGIWQRGLIVSGRGEQ